MISCDAGRPRKAQKSRDVSSSIDNIVRVRHCAHVYIMCLVALLAVHTTLDVTATTAATHAMLLTRPVDFDALTWSAWTELHDAAAAAMVLERLYKRGPRVRAKILVATSITMNELLAGDAIFRQQLSDVVGTRAARVQLEFLETTALRETDRGSYTAAFGISALPDPVRVNVPNNASSTSSNDTLATATLAVAIEQERERIVERLRFGDTIRGVNASVSPLTLFGTAAQLVGVALDGETFYQLDLKPWLGARLAIVPATTSSPSSIGNVSSSSVTFEPRYASAQDAIANLRLRFVLAKPLLPLRIDTSDILVREAQRRPPFASYYTHAASVVEVEVHVADERLRAAVDGRWRDAALAQAFSAAEPQWTIAAIDMEPAAGRLFVPAVLPSAATAAPTPTATSTVELTFTLTNVAFAHVERRKWRVLEQLVAYVAASGCSTCRIRIARIALPPVDALRDASDEGDARSSSAHHRFPSFDALDPINARSTTLVVAVDAAAPDDTLPSPFYWGDTLQSSVTYSADLCVTLGVVEAQELALSLTTSSPSCALASYTNKSTLSPGATTTTASEPFVVVELLLGLTSHARIASRTLEELAASAFVHHRVRCALLVVLQQVAVRDAHVQQLTAAAVKAAALTLRYRIAIVDESQRRGIVQHVQSRRLARAIATYANELLSVRRCSVAIHADGSLRLEDKLPGFAASLVNMSSSSSSEVEDEATAASVNDNSNDRLLPFVYLFNRSIEVPSSRNSSNSNTPTNASLVLSCPPRGRVNSTAASLLLPLACVAIQFIDALGSNAHVVLLRQIESSAELTTPSFVLPPPAALDATTASPPSSLLDTNTQAPWSETLTGTTPWIFYVNTTQTDARNATATLRFTLDVVRRRAVTTSTFSAVLATFNVEIELRLAAATTDRSLTVRKTSFLPLVAFTTTSSDVAATMLVDSTVVHPFVTAQLQRPHASDTTIALTIHRSRVGANLFVHDDACRACSASFGTCDASLECRALSTCVGSFANANPTLFASLWTARNVNASLLNASDRSGVNVLDMSWLLEQCLSSNSRDQQTWTQSTLALFLDSVRCASQEHCAVASSNDTTTFAFEAEAGIPTATATTRTLALRHTPVALTLAFLRDDFAATLEFIVDITDTASAAARSVVIANVTHANASLVDLARQLATLASAQPLRTASSPFVTVERIASSNNSISNNNTFAGAVIRIQFFVVAAWTAFAANRLVLQVQTLSGDVASVTTMSNTERLELVLRAS